MPTRYVFVPTMVVSGLWMWKGHVVRRWFSSKPALQAAVIARAEFPIVVET